MHFVPQLFFIIVIRNNFENIYRIEWDPLLYLIIYWEYRMSPTCFADSTIGKTFDECCCRRHKYRQTFLIPDTWFLEQESGQGLWIDY